jgi:hypothetical protein
LFLQTVWARAAILGIDPSKRVSFHGNTLISAAGGFRPGCLGDLRYRDVIMAILRDPDDPSRVRPAATITIRRNKMTNSLSYRRDDA